MVDYKLGSIKKKKRGLGGGNSSTWVRAGRLGGGTGTLSLGCMQACMSLVIDGEPRFCKQAEQADQS